MGSFYDLLLASKLSGGGGGGGGIPSGNAFFQRYADVSKLEISEAFEAKSVFLGGLCGATAICLWNATGVNGQYGAQNFITSCQHVVTIVLPKITRVCVGMISNCPNLEALDLGSCSQIDMSALANNNKLAKIIIRSQNIPGLANANALNNTPFKSGGTGGEIYIPKSLYDHLGDGTANDYKAASNWSTLNGYGTVTWKQIEGSIYETAYADGTPISA